MDQIAKQSLSRCSYILGESEAERKNERWLSEGMAERVVKRKRVDTNCLYNLKLKKYV